MLTTSKVFAGGLAAATSAVLGSYFGVFGTVGGAAAGSVATALSSEIYQRSIEKTSRHVRSRVSGTRSARRGEDPQERFADAPRGSAMPRLLVGTLVIFALGIGAVTGVEFLRGAPLSGGTEETSHGSPLTTSVTSVVGDLLGTSERSSDSGDSVPSSDDRPGRKDPGLVGGLLSGL